MILLVLLATAIAIAAYKKGEGADPDPEPLGASLEPSRGDRELAEVQSYELGGYTLVVGVAEDGLYDWRLWQTPVFEENKNPNGHEVAQGFDAADHEQAIVEAQDWMQAQEPDPAGIAYTRRGVRLSGDCSKLTVEDLKVWIAYASKVVEENEEKHPNAERIMVEAFGRLFPECDLMAMQPSIRGVAWDDARKRVQSVIDKIVNGKWLSVEPVEEAVAARLVGMSAPVIPDAIAEWHIGVNNGNLHSIVVVPKDSGAEYWLWQGARAKWSEAFRRGDEESVPKAQAEARELADAYYNAGAVAVP